MRRLITTLAILVVVLAAGMTALVLLVNPNDFRNYMTRQVEQRSGYKMTIDGNLRWHVWPQLSILSGRIILKAPGAAQPIITAENMRLDVNLLPLLSHQLSVKQVMLKGAVLRLTADSQRQSPEGAPVAPSGSSELTSTFGGDWSFDIASLQLSDSLVIWQQPDGNELNMRGVNFSMVQDSHHQVSFDLSSQLNRNLRALQFSLSGKMDASQYPERLSVWLNEARYHLSGPDLPDEGVKGKVSLKASWQNDGDKFSLNNISFSANDSQIEGKISGSLTNYPQLNINLHALNLNLDTLIGFKSSKGSEKNTALSSALPPIIARPAIYNSADSPLNKIDGTLALTMGKFQWRGLVFNDVQLNATNDRGLLTLSRFEGKSAEGYFSLPGSIDMRGKFTLVSLKPDIQSLNVAALLKAFDLPVILSGEMNVQGAFTGRGMSLAAAKQDWQGNADVQLKEAKFSGLNFARMIQQAAHRSDPQVMADEQDASGMLKQLSASASLKNGVINLQDIQGVNQVMTLQGQGQVNMQHQTSDVLFAITVNGGWKGDSQLVQRLQITPIPLRIYGNWDNPSYSLHLDDVLRNQLKDEALKRLRQWQNSHN